MSFLMPVLHHRDYYSLVVHFEIEKYPPVLVFIFKTILVNGVPCISIQHSKFSLSISPKMSVDILIGIVWNL